MIGISLYELIFVMFVIFVNRLNYLLVVRDDKMGKNIKFS